MSFQKKEVIFAVPAYDKNTDFSIEQAMHLKGDKLGMTAWKIQRQSAFGNHTLSNSDTIYLGNSLETLEYAYRKGNSLCIYALLVPCYLMENKASDPNHWQDALYSQTEKQHLLKNGQCKSYRIDALNRIGIFELPESEIQVIGCYYQNIPSKIERLYLSDREMKYEPAYRIDWDDSGIVDSTPHDAKEFAMSLFRQQFQNFETLPLEMKISNPDKQFKNKLSFFQNEKKFVDCAFKFEP